MTIVEMRTLLGLGSGVTDAAVVAAYVDYLEGQPAAAEPVSLAEAKDHLNLINDTSRDAHIQSLVVAAREWVEEHVGQVLTARRVVETRDAFNGFVDLYAWPIRSVQAIAYLDGLGVERELVPGDWLASLTRRPVRLMAGLGRTFPLVAAAAGAVTLIVDAGYATPDEVPEKLKLAIKVLIAAWFDDRADGDVPGAVLALCRSSRLEIC